MNKIKDIDQESVGTLMSAIGSIINAVVEVAKAFDALQKGKPANLAPEA